MELWKNVNQISTKLLLLVLNLRRSKFFYFYRTHA
jgi:hypothetical protein